MFSKIDVPGLLCGFVKNGLAPGRCEQIVAHCEKKRNYQPGLVDGTDLDTSIRVAEKCSVDDIPGLREEIFLACKPHLPVYEGITPVGLSHLNLVKYSQGGYFKKHFDESYLVGDSSAETTVIVYLNDDFDGGCTSFYDCDRVVTHIPKQGDILMFDHEHMHEGHVVTQGTKYIIRCDILYNE
jgi:2OG-Fe(II) oxygenase superfamily